jgi:DNA-binding GntR family transcriptional regulator
MSLLSYIPTSLTGGDVPIPEGAGPIPKVLTRERVLETIRDWIVSGTLTPGEEIRDGELAEALGVSRSPVRVALVELQREGLVERAPNGHVSVVRLSVDDLERMIPVWMELEVLAARQATARAARGDGVQEIEAANTDFSAIADQALTSENPADLALVQSANDRFHAAILAAADNRFLAAPLSALRAHNRRYERAYFTGVPDLARLSADDHEAIVAAIRSGDPDAAANAMRRHIERGWLLVERLRGAVNRQ